MKKYLAAIILVFLFVVPTTSSAQKIRISDTSNRWMTYFYQSQGASNGFAVYRVFTYLDSIAEENGHQYSILNNNNEGFY